MEQSKDFVTWTDKLACGVKLIDDQHKALVDLINDMFNHATGNAVEEHDYFNKVIQETVNYVKNHFAAEERIMQATKFAGFTDHKKEHEKFIRAVVDHIKDYESGKRYTLSTFTRVLKDWVLSHIALVDKQYFEYFRKIATRKDDGRLSISTDDIKSAGS